MATDGNTPVTADTRVVTDTPVAAAQGVSKRFGRDGTAALERVDLTVIPGHMTGLVGPDGAGKTTMIRILAGLIRPDEGRVSVMGQDVEHMDRGLIGYMPQRFGLYEDLTVHENLRLYADLRALPREERDARFAELLAFTDLTRFTKRLAGNLSGGMKQKLGLACALVRRPRLLLLDEPGVGVDPLARRELWSMVSDLLHEGVGVLWSTAYLDEAERCDVVHLLHEGHLLYAGAPAQLTQRVAGRVYKVPVPADARRRLLREALDHESISDGVVQGSAIRLLARGPAPGQAELGEYASRLQSAAPRFEDAFVDALGGGPRGSSELAAGYRHIPPREEAVIVAAGLTKRFADFTAAADISFEVPRGQIFGLLGPNGAGKSTTFKMLCGLLTPSAGSGSVDGYDLRTARADARQALGYMAQKFSLYGEQSVAQNLQFFASAYGLGRGAQRQAIERVIGVFHLERFLKTNSGLLPLGYKQRLALACAVLHEPPVLFLDEPTSGVDPIVRREFWMHINGLVERGVTVLVTTHFMDEAEYCDRIALIYHGRQIALGSPDELKAQVRKPGQEEPTLEDAFISILGDFDRNQGRAAA